MTTHNNRTTRTKLAMTVAVAALTISSSALAQATAPAKEAEVVVVTGSRIATASNRAISPIQVLDADTIRASGQIDIDQLLKEQNQFLPSTGQTTSPALLESHGASTLDMRGLGQNRTLVLVNGQRATPNGFRNSVDVNTIPSTLIKRIEYLTGGAAAVYGADAVAGVTNFILNDSYDGLEITATGNVSGQGDAESYTIGATYGKNLFDDRFNITGHVAYSDRGILLRSDRDWAKREVNDLGQPFGTSTNTTTGAITGISTIGGQFTRVGAGPGFNLTSIGGPASATSFFVRNNSSLSVLNPLEDTSQFEAFINPLDRLNAAVFSKFEISKNLELYGRYQWSKVNNESWTIPVNALTNNPTGQNSVLIRRDNPFITPELATIFAPAWNLAVGGVGAGNQSMRLTTNRIMSEFGRRQDNTERLLSQAVIGIKGEITPTIRYDVSYIKGNNREDVLRSNAGLGARFNQAADVTVGTNGQAVCVDTSNGCVPMNIFGVGKMSAEAIAWVGGGQFLFNVRKREQTVLAAVVNGDSTGLFNLPGGPLAWSLGLEQRKEWASTQFGERSNLAQTMASQAPNPPSNPNNGRRLSERAEYDLNEAFLEVRAPVLADLPFIKSLDLELAYRTSDHSQAGKYDTSKLGFNWSVNDSFRFRGSQQSVVRGANLGELFALINFPVVTATLNDPCARTTLAATSATFCRTAGAPAPGYVENIGGATGTVVTPQGGNAKMQPETGETYTYGFVFTPQFARGLSVIVDYYNISIDNAISGISAQETLDACYLFELDVAGSICERITRSPTTGQITQILANDFNISKLETSGYDFSVYYAAALPAELPGDRINIAFTGGIVDTFIRQPTKYVAPVDCAGKFGNQASSCSEGGLGTRAVPEFKSNLSVNWTAGKLSLRGAWRYQGSVVSLTPGVPNTANAGAANLVQKIPGWDYFDLGASYRFNDNLRASLSISNVFDKDPPILGSAQQDANTLPNQYDIIGRRFGLNIVWKM
jgi:iron complex outermembrane recepter protein